MATETAVVPPASIGTEMHNNIDWMDIFDNAEILIGAENAGAEVLSAPNTNADPIEQPVQDSPAQPPQQPQPQPQPPLPSNPHSEDGPRAVTPQASTELNSTDPARTTTTTTTTSSVSNEDKRLARSERKRSREKQRRLDVNAQILELTSVLQKVEAEENDPEDPSFAANTSSPGNRVDLIGRTIATLSRMHNENGKRHREITELQEKVTAAKKRLKSTEEQSHLAAQQSMMMPMMNGGFAPMQSLMYPTACVANPMMAMYNAMTQPKTMFDFNKPQTLLQAAPTVLPPSVFQTVIPKTATTPPATEKNMTANLAHCA